MIIRIAREANGLVIDIDGTGLAPPTFVLHDALLNDRAGGQRASYGGGWSEDARARPGMGGQGETIDAGLPPLQPRSRGRWRRLSYVGTAAVFVVALAAGMVIRGDGSHAGANSHLAALTAREMPLPLEPRFVAPETHEMIEHGTDSNRHPWVRGVLRSLRRFEPHERAESELRESAENAAVEPDRALAAAPGDAGGVPPAEAVAVMPDRGERASAPPATAMPEAITEALAAPPVIVPVRPEERPANSDDRPGGQPAAPSSAAPANPAALFGLQP